MTQVLFFISTEDIDECLEQNPCLNDGKCLNAEGNYSCFCKPGYEGRNCESCK